MMTLIKKTKKCVFVFKSKQRFLFLKLHPCLSVVYFAFDPTSAFSAFISVQSRF